MSVLEIETPVVASPVVDSPVVDSPAATAVASTKPGPRRTRPEKRPARGHGRGNGPRLRPVRSVPAPSFVPEARSAARACTAEPRLRVLPAPAATRTASWRLTDRGIAVVLVTVAMVTVAALAVLVPTALRVTGDSYQPLGSSQITTP